MTLEEEIHDQVAMAERDPAFITALKNRLMTSGLWEAMGCPMPRVKQDRPPPPAPEIETVTAIRAALFDNWPHGLFVKGHPNRWGMTIELWDRPADEIEAVRLNTMNFNFRTNVSLMDGNALKSQARHLRKPRVNPLSNVDHGYLDALLELSSHCPTSLIGMFNTTIGTDDSDYHRGLYYHPYQFVLVTVTDGAVESALISTGGGSIDLAPFVNTDCVGNPLKGKVASQSRTDIIGFDPSWASNME